MKGIIFDLAERIVEAEHGADTWDELLDTAGLDGVYTAVGNYPDEEFHALVQATAARLGWSPQEVHRWIGRRAMPSLAERYPAFFTPPDTRSFLLTLNDVIHPEVRKLYPGADVPDFRFEEPSADELVIDYRSHRRMCGFAEGLIHGAGDRYGETVTIVQDDCMLRGDPSCRLHCTFAPVAASR